MIRTTHAIGCSRPAPRQRGVFLLEALVAILIIAFGVLGSVGLLARSVQNVDDAKYRGEAAYLANSLIGLMWVDDRTTLNLAASYGTGGVPGYAEFAAVVAQRLPSTPLTPPPDVVVVAGPTANSSVVTITIFWQPPGDTDPLLARPPHRHQASATIASN